ncbi:RagB/SusD family nutrient uptake outer membrane protein [Mariniflexile gromovii]|uniref:RagB/SusD family nutrient uptake outer membrane protein n=1 Tax=Mariniflexile gromovii TaxID=362523 RepID=A0ABS4BWF4_9FLAO|nr:RagB/SusD family nutrient uptake outer membrane protein [Mariniflexile gromovii]MBP0904920.1 RagB/SusD family nutrient uptake outer membrane protein [Mariniflexile gromovii]
MKNIYILLGSLLFITACSTDLDQYPPNIASSDSLTDFTGVLNAAYFYQIDTSTPMVVMGDFRADNAYMFESPYSEFDDFDNGLTAMEDQFFGPFYTALYKSILSSNIVILNSSNAKQVAEAKFLRALSYFKLVRVFGDVTINLSDSPSLTDTSILARKPVAQVYDNVIIPDLTDAIAVLGTARTEGRASKYAAQGLLGKVYVQRGDFTSALPHLSAVVTGASAAGINLKNTFASVFGSANDLNSEILFATQITSSINGEYTFASRFATWSSGSDTKSPTPLDASLIAAFNASPGDTRRAVTFNAAETASIKWGGAEQDWIELRFADILLLYAEALNETGASAAVALAPLNSLYPTVSIRSRAGLADLNPATLNTQALVRTAIANERRLELAFEGQRWFDLVRTGTAQTALGKTFDNNYYLFPVPISELSASFNVITQNPGY